MLKQREMVDDSMQEIQLELVQSLGILREGQRGVELLENTLLNLTRAILNEGFLQHNTFCIRLLLLRIDQIHNLLVIMQLLCLLLQDHLGDLVEQLVGIIPLEVEQEVPFGFGDQLGLAFREEVSFDLGLDVGGDELGVRVEDGFDDVSGVEGDVGSLNVPEDLVEDEVYSGVGYFGVQPGTDDSPECFRSVQTLELLLH